MSTAATDPPESLPAQLHRLHRELAEARAQRDALAVLAGELIAAIRINSLNRSASYASFAQIDAYLHPFETRLKSATEAP